MKIRIDEVGIAVLEEGITFPDVAWALRAVVCALPVETAEGVQDEWYGYLPSK